MGNYPELSGWTQWDHKGPLKSREGAMTAQVESESPADATLQVLKMEEGVHELGNVGGFQKLEKSRK